SVWVSGTVPSSSVLRRTASSYRACPAARSSGVQKPPGVGTTVMNCPSRFSMSALFLLSRISVLSKVTVGGDLQAALVLASSHRDPVSPAAARRHRTGQASSSRGDAVLDQQGGEEDDESDTQPMPSPWTPDRRRPRAARRARSRRLPY